MCSRHCCLNGESYPVEINYHVITEVELKTLTNTHCYWKQSNENLHAIHTSLLLYVNNSERYFFFTHIVNTESYLGQE